MGDYSWENSPLFTIKPPFFTLLKNHDFPDEFLLSLPSPGDWFPGREEVRVGETERWLGAAGCGGSIQNTSIVWNP